MNNWDEVAPVANGGGWFLSMFLLLKSGDFFAYFLTLKLFFFVEGRGVY